MYSIAIAADEAQAKARIYSFLAGLFSSHPTSDAVRALEQIAAELGIDCPRGLSLDDLEREYMDLFVVPGPRYVAPYESVFRDEWTLPPLLKKGSNPAETGAKIKGLLMGESTLQVRRAYLMAGLLPEADLPDHIANELGFLASLSGQQATATPAEVRRLAEAGENFRRAHVLKWIGDLRQRIEQREQLGYYGTAIRVVEAVVRDDEARDEAQAEYELAPAGVV